MMVRRRCLQKIATLVSTREGKNGRKVRLNEARRHHCQRYGFLRSHLTFFLPHFVVLCECIYVTSLDLEVPTTAPGSAVSFMSIDVIFLRIEIFSNVPQWLDSLTDENDLKQFSAKFRSILFEIFRKRCEARNLYCWHWRIRDKRLTSFKLQKEKRWRKGRKFVKRLRGWQSSE